MTEIIFENKNYSLNAGETVLDALLRQGVKLSYSCKGGVCHACILQLESGEIPAESASGLKSAWQDCGYFLACQCRPSGSLTISLPPDRPAEYQYRVASNRRLSPDILCLCLRPSTPVEAMRYRAGQYINLQFNGESRSYSLASVPQLDEMLELHVKLPPSGKFSQALLTSLKEHDEVTVQGPLGDCIYTDELDNKELICIGLGTGLAPLIGIIRDALRQGHGGKIQLVQGAKTAAGLYSLEALQALAALYTNFDYQLCVLSDQTQDLPTLALPTQALPTQALPTQALPTQAEYGQQQLARLASYGRDVQEGSIYSIATGLITEPRRVAAFVCGASSFVAKMQKALFMSGVSLSSIYSDAFSASGTAHQQKR